MIIYSFLNGISFCIHYTFNKKMIICKWCVTISSTTISVEDKQITKQQRGQMKMRKWGTALKSCNWIVLGLSPLPYTNLVWNEICFEYSLLDAFPVSLLGSDGALNFLLRTGLSAVLCDNSLWCDTGDGGCFGLSGGRAGEDPGVLIGVDDTELVLVILGDEGREWVGCVLGGPLVQGWDRICSRVGLSLGLTANIQEMRSLASVKTYTNMINMN